MSMYVCEGFSSLDAEVIEDFYACFVEAREEIEGCCSSLDRAYDAEVLNSMFRSMHSLKGNCRMVFMDPFVEAFHLLEELVSDIRAGKCEYSPEMGEFFVESVARLEEMVQAMIHKGQVAQDRLDSISKDIRDIREASVDQRSALIKQFMEQVTVAGVAPEISESEEEAPGSLTGDDLDFFYELALKMDAIGIYQRERISHVLRLCMEINDELGLTVPPDQLSAAVYMHDVGLALLPRKLVAKDPEQMNRDEAALYYDHVRIGSEMLRRMHGWQQAADMVEHSHERFDGRGYPAGLMGDQISTGGMILSVVDRYQYVINLHSDKSFRKTLLRAVTEINSNAGGAFEPAVVEAFNLVIRRQFVSKS